jgi:6-phosphogluconolactonase (cycloisomerase 2 family)
MSSVWIGTYPPDGLGTPAGKGEGVWRVDVGHHGELTAHQVSVINAPSYVAAHPTADVLYAVSEVNPTVLTAFTSQSPDSPVATVEVGGDSGCHAGVIADGRSLVVCNYGTGELAVVQLDRDGIPVATAPQQFFAHHGAGPREDRQEGPHAHFSGVAPGGQHLLVADLGSDTLWCYSIGAEGLLQPQGVATALPPGSGPRHFAVHGELIYVVCELDHTLRTLRWDRVSATAEIIDEQPVTLAPQRTGDTVYDAHIEIIDGRTGPVLLASVRGADVISVFDLAPEGQARYRAAFDTGHWPRHFAITADAGGTERLVVTNEKAHVVRAFALAGVLALPPETEWGAIAQLDSTSAAVTSPACMCVGPRSVASIT